ncbi:protein of unknown function DUF214 [Leptothrix cholodnii SP-6]|uniref:ABC3 transporter permease C-terminal domain-containing protein n=1 Tax=Leptothrix cholodnii (strain ATCC 51168 / LMG 8142 / SP-6) TaxID=395495 RepID=B1Y5G3_LEPCP|nr:ABC transporter permease [Leptothrix cholodnii]ACB33551.1 protein of unknown function DUF214 [Leptothrix cholodnii SP-6]
MNGTGGWASAQSLWLIGLEWRQHPGRLLVALLAIALGVALALAVHLINASALAEFGSAVRSVNGQPDFELRPASGAGLPEALYETVAALPQVALASPVIEIDSIAIDPQGAKRSLRVLGLDALVAATLAPALRPRADPGTDRLAMLDPDQVFLNPAALALVDPINRGSGSLRQLRVQGGARLLTLTVAGSVSADGPPLAVIDIAGAQSHFDRLGRLSRIDLRLAAGADRDGLQRALDAAGVTGVRLAAPGESTLRISNLSRAYRVNLTVLALVALFTGAFLVFSVQALAVAKRVPQLALLGVLGMDARARLRLVLLESAAIGLIGALIGVALGTGLALLALEVLGGDLGSGLFGGSAPPLQWSASAAAIYAALGMAAALAGGWLPARQAQRLAPAQSLKGLGGDDVGAPRPWLGPLLLLAAPLLALLPPVGDLPLAAYASVACLLLGGIVCVPALVGAVLARLAPPLQPIWLLAVERARDQRQVATIAVAGVVASLALSVALTVMVASFRDSVSQWLEQVLPADLYVRTASSSAQADSVYLEPALLQAAAALPGVARLQTQRLVPLDLDPQRAPVTLIAREIADPATGLPLVGALVDAPASDRDLPVVYASEGYMALYGARPGQRITLPLPDGRRADVWLRGVWRDYARQQGAIAIERSQWRALTGDERVNDLGLWLQPGADPAAVQQALRGLAGNPALLEFATPAAIRATSLAIFDRSFAVTYWLQAVAIGIGLAGIAASFSAQVLARRREFGALMHLGLPRSGVLALVCAEGALWSAVGTVLGLLLGVGVSVVLVHVVNPQSFHWTMDLSLPLPRLAALAAAVLAAGVATAWLSGRAAAGREMVLAVKEDW